MSKLNKTAFIVEGSREANILTRIVKTLPEKSILDVMLILPAEMNIYMLWKEIKNEPDINIIDYLKEKSKSISDILGEMNSDDFSQTFLFFDLDAQQDNIKCDNKNEWIKIIKSMLDTFNNETEKGKLYISYPMCEAYSDYITGTCKTYTSSCYQNPFKKGYKSSVGKNNVNSILTHLDIKKVNEIVACYLDRVSCIFSFDNAVSFTKAKEISNTNIFYKQQELLEKGYIVVLSAFPKFLIDYYKIDAIKNIFQYVKTNYKVNCEIKYGESK